MRDTPEPTRRRFIATAAGITAAGLSGCQGLFSSGNSPDSNQTADDDPTGTPADTPSGESTRSGESSRFQPVERFETDLADWQRNEGVGRGSGIQNEVVRSGSSALELVNLAALDCSYISLPGDGLGTYPSLGDDVAVWMRNGGGDGPKLGLCYLWQSVGSYTQSPGSGYAAQVNPVENQIQLKKIVDGDGVNIGSAPTSEELSTGTWYQMKVETSPGGDHRFTLLDATGTELGAVSIIDDQWESGGYGVAYSGNNTSGESSYWDNLAIKSN